MRTNSASEPPRSIVLLGKRDDRDGGEETPASHRSVRQRVDAEAGSLPFNLPLPLFTAGGSGAAAAADIANMSGELDASAADSSQRKQQKTDEEADEGRHGTRGRSKRKQHVAPPVKNRRKPAKSSLRDNWGHGFVGGRAYSRVRIVLWTTEHVLDSM